MKLCSLIFLLASFPLLGARHTNGSSDKIYSGVITPGTNFTISLWVNGDAAPGTASISSVLSMQSDTSGTFTAIGFQWNHTNAAFEQACFFRDTSNTYHTAKLTSTLSGSTWYHIACTFDGADFIAYLNGSAETDTPTATTPITTATGVCLGGGNTSGPPCGTPNFAGSIAEVAVWSSALNASQVASLRFNKPSQVKSSTLQIYLPLHGFASPEAGLSGNFKNATVTGTTLANHCPCGN